MFDSFPARQLELGKLNPKLRILIDRKAKIMRSGNYETSESGGAGTAITFLLIGLGAGALVGLLFAPKTGKRMRKELLRKYQEARTTLDDWKDEIRDAAGDVVERGSEIAEDLRERVTPLTRGIRR
jgi:hypothetical protein